MSINIHIYAKRIIEKAINSYELKSLHRFTMEGFMRQLIHQYDIFELLHVTDDMGFQITNNIAKVDFKAHYGSKGF